jgi:hypothetical protein
VAEGASELGCDRGDLFLLLDAPPAAEWWYVQEIGRASRKGYIPASHLAVVLDQPAPPPGAAAAVPALAAKTAGGPAVPAGLLPAVLAEVRRGCGPFGLLIVVWMQHPHRFSSPFVS